MVFAVRGHRCSVGGLVRAALAGEEILAVGYRRRRDRGAGVRRDGNLRIDGRLLLSRNRDLRGEGRPLPSSPVSGGLRRGRRPGGGLRLTTGRGRTVVRMAASPPGEAPFG